MAPRAERGARKANCGRWKTEGGRRGAGIREKRTIDGKSRANMNRGGKGAHSRSFEVI